MCSLYQRVGPLRLEGIAGTGIVGRIVAWRANGNGSNQLAIDGGVQRRPSFSIWPVGITWQDVALLVVLGASQLCQEHRPDELCNEKGSHLAESLEGVQQVVMMPKRQPHSLIYRRYISPFSISRPRRKPVVEYALSRRSSRRRIFAWNASRVCFLLQHAAPKRSTYKPSHPKSLPLFAY